LFCESPEECDGDRIANYCLFRGGNNGGISDRSDCENLPTNLQAGCYWRFNWAGGDVNGWDIAYKQVSCPDRLKGVSGCETKFNG
jgi:hypothetical protein